MKKKLLVKKTIKHIWRMVFLQGFVLLAFSSIVAAITVSLPQQNDAEDVMVTGPAVIDAKESDLFDTIQVVNRYLWFAIGAICMGVVIYAGIQLMTSQGDQEKMKKANQLLLGATIGIFVAVLSYAIVRIVVNLF